MIFNINKNIYIKMNIAVRQFSIFNNSVDNSVDNFVDNSFDNSVDHSLNRYLNLKTDSLVRLFKDMDETIKLDPLIEYQLLYKQ